MQLALIDNNDSFTYNLQQALRKVSAEVEVIPEIEKDKLDIEQYDGLVISPGPGIPEEYHSYLGWLDSLGSSPKILGVCLGMQILALWKGYRTYRKDEIIHGNVSELLFLANSKYTRNLSQGMQVGLYHSWAVDARSADYFEPLATDAEGTLMMMSHADILGLQFHPESFLTRQGLQVLANWVGTASD